MKDITRRDFIVSTSIAGAMAVTASAQKRPKTKPDCIFCKIVAGTAPAFKIWEDKHFFAFLDNKPITPGHTLVVPKEHDSYLFEMSEDDYERIFDRVRRLERPLRQAMGVKRIGLIVEGFGVDHVHVHMVPISKSGELLQKGRPGVTSEEFAATADTIRRAIGTK